MNMLLQLINYYTVHELCSIMPHIVERFEILRFRSYIIWIRASMDNTDLTMA